MSEEKIEVIAYSGYRGEETPRAILLHGKRIEVIEILKQWIEEKSDDRDRKRFYQVKGSDGILHRIYYDERTMEMVSHSLSLRGSHSKWCYPYSSFYLVSFSL